MHRFLELKVRPWNLLALAGSLVCIGTVAGFAGQLWWIFDLFAHFRVQYAVVLTLFVLLFTLGKQFRFAAIMAAGVAVNLATIIPYYIPNRSDTHLTEASTVRAVVANVHTANKRYDRLCELIRSTDPDFVVLLEVDQRWMNGLADLRAAYPHQKTEPREDNFGVALLSKHPLQEAEIIYAGDAQVPSVLANMQVNGKRFWILGTHPLPPSNQESAKLRDQQLANLAEALAKLQGPKLLVGDLNTTPWSSCFSQFLRKAHLRDSAKGHGIQPTWPTFFPAMRIPIDHCLCSPEIQLIGRKVGAEIGSDHFPLVIEFAIR